MIIDIRKYEYIVAASEGLAVVGIALGVAVLVEAVKWGINVRVKGSD